MPKRSNLKWRVSEVNTQDVKERHGNRRAERKETGGNMRHHHRVRSLFRDILEKNEARDANKFSKKNWGGAVEDGSRL